MGKDGLHYYEKGQKETERDNGKTEGQNKARETDELFAFVLVRKERVVAECTWKWRESAREGGPDKMK